MEDDERFTNLVKNLHTSYTGKDYTVSKTANIPIESLDSLSKKSYPMCMRVIHESLRSKHHLKHGGRMQYGLFLKGIGVTLEDSLRFWREEFTKTIDLEKFEKAYSYNIRHNYGKQGSMVNYTPYSCLKIINTTVGPQDVCGCPFKMLEQSSLKTKLASYGVGIGHAQEIVGYASKGHIQLACGRYFEVSHDQTIDQGINHPNQYFEMSQAIMEQRAPSDSIARKSLNKTKVGDDTLNDSNMDNSMVY